MRIFYHFVAFCKIFDYVAKVDALTIFTSFYLVHET
jgi:hypothetical protein